eukprot:RCo022123
MASATGVSAVGNLSTPAEEGLAEPSEELLVAIMNQVNYYFSKKNLSRDKFLQDAIRKNPEGFVSLDTLITFPKLKALSTDFDVLATAMRRSSELVVSEDGKQVRSKDDHLAALGTPVGIGSRTFGNVGEMKKYFRSILHRYDRGMVLEKKDQDDVLELLQKYHPDAQGKMGDGVKAVEAGSNAQFPDTLCFVVRRNDDTTMDFSYIKCVEAAFVGR